MFETLIIASVLLIGIGCRSFQIKSVHKLGSLCFVFATFLVGYFLGNRNILLGIIFTSGWFLLPLISIFVTSRNLRLPLEKKLRNRFPPNRDVFPQLPEFTSKVENEGFEHIQDSGWEWEDRDQFIRFFYDDGSKLQATINFNRLSDFGIAYITLCTRTNDGKTLTTWNNPYRLPMQLQPDCMINVVKDTNSFSELIEMHKKFLRNKGISDSDLKETDTDNLDKLAEKDMRDQIDHNLDKGFLKLTGNGTFSYSYKGLFYVWFQSTKDIIRYFFS